jgi:hypothetical protein
MTLRERQISDRRLREPLKPLTRITSITAVISDHIRYGLYSLYHDVLITIVSCHGWRPPNHLYVILLYDNRTDVDQCLWLSFDCLGSLSTRFLGESFGIHSQGE